MLLSKRIIVALFLLFTFIHIVNAAEYNIEISEIDRFICKKVGFGDNFHTNYENMVDNPGLNKSSSNLFNESFVKTIKVYEQLRIDWGGNGYMLVYFISRDQIEYRIQTNGDWYSVKAKISNKIDSDEFKKEYYLFERDLKNIKSALKSGIESATNFKCFVGSDYNHGLLRIFNIYDYPVETLNCVQESSSTRIDCTNEPIVNEVILALWPNITYHDRRGYIWGNNRIFVDLDELIYNQEDDFNIMGEPIIVFSKSGFVSSFQSGQSIFVRHVEYLQEIEKLAIQIQRLDKNRDDIVTTLKEIQDDIETLKKLWLSKDAQKVRDKIYDLDKEYTNSEETYSGILGIAEGAYSETTNLINENPRKYYEDIYRGVIKKYTSDLNSKIFTFRDNKDRLEKKQEFYDTFSTSIISDINNQERTNNMLRGTIITILVTIFLFIINFFYKLYTHFQNQLDIMKTLIDDLNEIAKTSESYKDVFLQKVLIQYKKTRNKFRKNFDNIFKDYKNLVDTDSIEDMDHWLNKIKEKISKDTKILLKIKSFILMEGNTLTPNLRPQFKFKQINFDFYTKQLDYELQFFIFFKKFDTWQIKQSIHELINVIEVINNQVEHYYESGNYNKIYANLADLDKKLFNLFKYLISNKNIEEYWRSNMIKLKKLKNLTSRY